MCGQTVSFKLDTDIAYVGKKQDQLGTCRVLNNKYQQGTQRSLPQTGDMYSVLIYK